MSNLKKYRANKNTLEVLSLGEGRYPDDPPQVETFTTERFIHHDPRFLKLNDSKTDFELRPKGEIDVIVAEDKADKSAAKNILTSQPAIQPLLNQVDAAGFTPLQTVVVRTIARLAWHAVHILAKRGG